MSQQRALLNAAEAIAGRVDEQESGIAPELITSLLLTMLPELLRCFERNDQVSPEAMADRFREKYARHPVRMRNRITANVLNESRKPGQTRLSRAQAVAIADAMIDQMQATDDHKLTGVARAAGCGEING